MHMCEVTLVGKIPRCTDVQQQAMVFSLGTTTKYRTVNYPIRDSLNVSNQSQLLYITMLTLYAIKYAMIIMYVIKIFLNNTRQPSLVIVLLSNHTGL